MIKFNKTLAIKPFLEQIASLKLQAAKEPARVFIKKTYMLLHEAFKQNTPVRDLLKARSFWVDTVLKAVCNLEQWQKLPPLALVAVGGYGREELHPYSDIDLLLLFENEENKVKAQESIEIWVAWLWDIGLEIGHSVRTLLECKEQAKNDLTVVTNLMEARFLWGNETLFNALKINVNSQAMWPVNAYFKAKSKEQEDRHRKYHDNSYNLEPHLKGMPGGLRDLQTVEWIYKRYFGHFEKDDLVKKGFLLESEFALLQEGKIFLHTVRFVLQMKARRREERLLFDYQRQIATELGYQPTPAMLAVEQFMKKFYQTTLSLRGLLELLIRLFEENYLAEKNEKILPLSEFFENINGYLAVKNQSLFKKHEDQVIKLFIMMQTHPEIKGVRANTIRLIRKEVLRFKSYENQTETTRQDFLRLLSNPLGLTRQLRRMKKCGLLGVYLPAFGKIIGQMQYDLFHVYTVDEHTLFLVEKIESFYKEQNKNMLCETLAKQIFKPELLIISALFHDIAKGRGGDHSTLGAREVELFAKAHSLNQLEVNLVCWLVKNHLLFSLTAQKRDLSDPKVIQGFAEEVQDKMHLDYLYLLTVADIFATNPQLWNSWRASLLKDLYQKTIECLCRGIEKIPASKEIIFEKKIKTQAILERHFFSKTESQLELEKLDDDYFLRFSADDIAWQTEGLIKHPKKSYPLVLIRDAYQKGATEIFISCRDMDYLFALITAVLARLGLSIVDAQVASDKENRVLDTFLVLENTGEPIVSHGRKTEVQHALLDQLNQPEFCFVTIPRKPPSRNRYFSILTEIGFYEDNAKTIMELLTLDKPGLLAAIGQIFFDCKVVLHRAKIMTIGEKVEDVFYLTTDAGLKLDKECQEKLRVCVKEICDHN